MCSILIFAKDNINPNSTLDWQMWKTGYVVDISDNDNQWWGNDIDGPKKLGWWHVVVIPGAPAANYLALIAGDPAPDAIAPFRLRTVKLALFNVTATAVSTLQITAPDGVNTVQRQVVTDAIIQTNIVAIAPIAVQGGAI